MEVGPEWETLIERQIRDAQAEGRFDDLPHQGRPLPDDDNPLAGAWGLAFRVLHNAGVAPPWIEADKDVRSLLERRDGLLARAGGPGRSATARARDRADLATLVGRINDAIARLNAEAPTDRQHRRSLVLADELARFDAAEP